MTSISGSDISIFLFNLSYMIECFFLRVVRMISYKNLSWSDEQTRFYLQLRVEEIEKGNLRMQNANDTARKTIIEKFSERFGERHEWKKFGSKLTTCKKQFDSHKKLVHNRTGLGYFPDGSIDMFEDWWGERIKVYIASV